MQSLGGHYLSEEELHSLGFAKLGKNIKIHSRASIYGIQNIEIGDNVRIDDFSVIIATGKLKISSHVSIHNFCFLGAKFGLNIGNFVTFAPGVKIFTASDDYQGDFLTGVMVPPEMTGGKKGPIQISDHVIIGSGSVILPGCNIGEGCAVGALSLVKDSLPPWGIYAGIPVTLLKKRKKNLLKYTNKLLETV